MHPAKCAECLDALSFWDSGVQASVGSVCGRRTVLSLVGSAWDVPGKCLGSAGGASWLMPVAIVMNDNVHNFVRW